MKIMGMRIMEKATMTKMADMMDQKELQLKLTTI